MASQNRQLFKAGYQQLVQLKIWVEDRPEPYLVPAAGDFLLYQDSSGGPALFKRAAILSLTRAEEPSLPVDDLVLIGPAADDNLCAGDCRLALGYTRRPRDEEGDEQSVEQLVAAHVSLQPRDDENGSKIILDGLALLDEGFVTGVEIIGEFDADVEPVAPLPGPPNYFYGSPLLAALPLSDRVNWVLSVYFSGDGGLTAIERDNLIKKQLLGARIMWTKAGGVRIDDYPGQQLNSKGEETRLKITLAQNSVECGDQDPGSETIRTKDEIVLNTTCAKINCFLLAHELGHVFMLEHPNDPPEILTKPGSKCSIMAPGTPNVAINPYSNFINFNQNRLGSPRMESVGDTPIPNVDPQAACAGLRSGPTITVSSGAAISPPLHYFRNYHYDFGLAGNLPDNLAIRAHQIPRPPRLDFDAQDDWWGWDSTLWNWGSDATQRRPAGDVGYYHQDPIPNQDNFLHCHLYFADNQMQPFNKITVFFFLAEPFLGNDSAGNPQPMIRLKSLKAGDPQVSVWEITGQPAKLGVPQKRQFKWRPAAWNPQWWLVALAWSVNNGLEMLKLLVPKAQTWQTIQTRFNATAGPLSALGGPTTEDLLKSEFNVSDFSLTLPRDKVISWIGQHSCVGVRLPGDPRPIPLQFITPPPPSL